MGAVTGMLNEQCFEVITVIVVLKIYCSFEPSSHFEDIVIAVADLVLMMQSAPTDQTSQSIFLFGAVIDCWLGQWACCGGVFLKVLGLSLLIRADERKLLAPAVSHRCADSAD